ncbi:MAG: hypothetical protein LUD17_02510 [Bacteroidales bacterium]|nr:hypothetical protein [Bacteroidales bacterium]
MNKKSYLPPLCSMTHVVLEMGLCATDSGLPANVTTEGTIKVQEYKAVGDNDGFNDITFD